MLVLLDIFLSFLHFAIIAFNLFAWIFPATRKAHLITIGATAFSWFGLGIFFGWGYCPITEWEWNVKAKLGETNLPNSFIKYYADKITGKDINSTLIDNFTLGFFLAAVILSIYFNFFKKKRQSN
jgi:uncharacterized protein DUF2784